MKSRINEYLWNVPITVEDKFICGLRRLLDDDLVKEPTYTVTLTFMSDLDVCQTDHVNCLNCEDIHLKNKVIFIYECVRVKVLPVSIANETESERNK